MKCSFYIRRGKIMWGAKTQLYSSIKQTHHSFSIFCFSLFLSVSFFHIHSLQCLICSFSYLCICYIFLMQVECLFLPVKEYNCHQPPHFNFCNLWYQIRGIYLCVCVCVCVCVWHLLVPKMKKKRTERRVLIAISCCLVLRCLALL